MGEEGLRRLTQTHPLQAVELVQFPLDLALEALVPEQ
jgi:hypothetical protein